VVYGTGPQLLEQRPIFLSVFFGGKINTMLVAQLLFAKAKEGTKGRIYEEWLTFQVLNRNSDGTRVENVTEKPRIGGRSGRDAPF
jgi:hypothetical protein